jgi:flagellar export protein FliJ
MKPFQFKLQAVLTLRQRAEQTALVRYSRAIERRRTAADQLAETEIALAEARRQWLHAMAEGCPAVRAAQMLDFCHLLEERKQQSEHTLHAADLELNDSSQLMLLARQQREAVEKFLARLRDRYERQLRIEERKLIDDLIHGRPPVSFSGRPAAGTLWN